MPAISREEQFAEELHAYTLQRLGRPNSRVKDLVDMLLLLDSGTLDPGRLAASIKATFRRRATHGVPVSPLPAPPSTWSAPFAELSTECGLPGNLSEQRRRLDDFLAAI